MPDGKIIEALEKWNEMKELEAEMITDESWTQEEVEEILKKEQMEERI